MPTWDEIKRRTPDSIIAGHELGKLLTDAGLIPPKTRRVIIDIDIDAPVRLYIEQFGTQRWLNVDWVKALTNPALVIERHTGETPTDAPGD